MLRVQQQNDRNDPILCHGPHHLLNRSQPCNGLCYSLRFRDLKDRDLVHATLEQQSSTRSRVGGCSFTMPTINCYIILKS